MVKNAKQKKTFDKKSKPAAKKAKITKKDEKKKKEEQIIEEEEPEFEKGINEEEEEDVDYNDDDDYDDENNGEELTFKKDGFMSIGENDDIDAVIAAIQAEDGDSDDDVIIDEGDDDDDDNVDDGDDGQDFIEETLGDDDDGDEEIIDEEEKKKVLIAKQKEEKIRNIEKLKEEERLYKSHLFKLQIEELVKGCTPEYDGPKGIATRFNTWLEKTLVPGLGGVATKDVFVPVGSFAARTMTVQKGKKLTVDVAVRIPDSAFAEISSKQENSGSKKNKKGKQKNNDVKQKNKSYEELKGEYMKKLFGAIEKSMGKTSKLSVVNGHQTLSTKDFDVTFRPAISKAIYDKYSNSADDTAAAKDFLCAESAAFFRKCTLGCRGLRDAIVLLKVWLHQRSMDILPDVIGHFALSTILGKLTDDSRANRQMTSYQLFTLAMETFGSGRLTSPFVDPITHKVDILGHMTRPSLRELQQEAKATIECLQTDVSPEGGFQETFLTRVDPCWKYDCILNIDPAKCGAGVTAGSIAELLLKALGKRCFVIREIPTVKHIAIGFVLDPAECIKCVERGPSADNIEGSKEFCDIWKSKAEIRHFKDGSIVQSVCNFLYYVIIYILSDYIY